MYDYRARFYDPLTGSFIQPDSIVPDALDPRAWNRLGYVYGNPVNYTDPSGHIPFWDVVDIGSFLWSASDFYNEPTWGNAGWLALDTVGLLPLLPSVGVVRRGLGLADEVGGAGFAGRCASNSFTADTLVQTNDGLVPIEAINVGDKVYAVDPDTDESGYFEVVEVFSHPTDTLIQVTVGNEVMQVTPDHPIYVEDKSWVDAEDLAEGDRLRRVDGGWATILALERVVLDTPVLVYNFTVQGVHTYFVLEVGVLVHNCLPTSANGFRGLADYPNGFPNRATGERFYGPPKGKFLDELTVDARRDQMALYVITNKGEIRMTLTDAGGRSYKGRTIHHSYLVNGENVYGAGEIYFDAAGQIRKINAISGHYNTVIWDRKPFGSQFREYMQKLLTERYGFQINDPRQIFDQSMYPTWP